MSRAGNLFSVSILYLQGQIQDQVTVKLIATELKLLSNDDALNYLARHKNTESSLPELVLDWLPANTGPFKELIEPLDSLIALEPDKWNEEDFLDRLIDGSVRFDGVTYGVPMFTSSSALYYNKKLLSNAGMQPPLTWDELIKTADALSDPTRNITGFELTSASSYPAYSWKLLLLMEGGEFASADGKQLLFNSEAGIKAAQLLKEVQEKQSFQFLPYGQEPRFEHEGSAMHISGSSFLRFITNLDFGVVPLPPGTGGAVTETGSSVNYMLKSTPIKEKATWDFLMWLSSPEITARIAPEWYYSLPIRKSSFKQQAWQEQLREEPRLQVFVDAYSSGKFLPYQTNYADTLGILDKHLTAMLDGTENAQQAIENAYKESQLNVKSWLDNE